MRDGACSSSLRLELLAGLAIAARAVRRSPPGSGGRATRSSASRMSATTARVDPLVVGRDDVPRGPLRARRRDGRPRRPSCSRPSTRARRGRRRRTSSACRVVRAGRGSGCFCSSLETCRKNLRIDRAVADQVLLEGVDVLVARLPELLAGLPGGSRWRSSSSGWTLTTSTSS